ncbi:MAG: GtrA family protein [Luteolibacter sp.]
MIHRFLFVGLLAMGAHFIAAAIAIFIGVPPLFANFLGFLLAVPVSYQGHRSWTFRESRTPHTVAFPRFAVISLSAFAVNEILYAAMLAHAPLHEIVSLALVLGSVAFGTFVLCRFWAFQSRTP